jgi:hypothetical protein
MPVIVPKAVLQQSIGAVVWLFAATEQQRLAAAQEDHKMAEEKQQQHVLAFVGNQVEWQVAVTACRRNVRLPRFQCVPGADLPGLHAGLLHANGVLLQDGGGAPLQSQIGEAHPRAYGVQDIGVQAQHPALGAPLIVEGGEAHAPDLCDPRERGVP